MTPAKHGAEALSPWVQDRCTQECTFEQLRDLLAMKFREAEAEDRRKSFKVIRGEKQIFAAKR
jgi:hypothetical protein